MTLFTGNNKEKYQTLLVSLPHLPLSFHDAYKPLVPAFLEERLEMIDAEDLPFFTLARQEMELSKNSRDIDEATMLKHHKKLEEEASTPAVRELFVFVHGVAVIVAALRMRKSDKTFDAADGELAAHIRRNWQHPSFRLGEQFPWIEDVRLLLEKDDVPAAHRRVCDIIWRFLRQQANNHYFDFEAVILYVLGWDVAHTWATRDLHKGKKRFLEITEEVIVNYGEIFG